MLPPEWLLTTPLDAILFDCDNTLSHIEGIDEIAAANGVGDKVKKLTEEAMGRSGINTDMYRDRLNITQPHEQQIAWLGQKYIQNVAEDVRAAIQLFQNLNKPVFIVSAGLLPAIIIFGKYLNIPTENIFAVDIAFDKNGKYLSFDESSVLAEKEGKKTIVRDVQKKYPRIGYSGDGLNDCPVQELVARFIGYGGACYRKNIADMCKYYLTSNSMAPILPLMLTEQESKKLLGEEKHLYQKGLSLIEESKIEFT